MTLSRKPQTSHNSGGYDRFITKKYWSSSWKASAMQLADTCVAVLSSFTHSCSWLSAGDVLDGILNVVCILYRV